MGLFSKIFGGAIKSFASNASFLGSYRVAGGKSYHGGGWGLDRFQSIIDAHSSIEDMVDEWDLDSERSNYMSLDGYPNCYTQAYQEEYDKCVIEAEILNMMMDMFGEEVDPEDLMDMDAVDENAYEYACELAQAWYDGQEWCPEEVMVDWAFYTLSSHNW